MNVIYLILFLAMTKTSCVDRCFLEQTNFRKIRIHGGKLMCYRRFILQIVEKIVIHSSLPLLKNGQLGK